MLLLLETPETEATVDAVSEARSDGGWRHAVHAYVADSPAGDRLGWHLLDHLRWRAA